MSTSTVFVIITDDYEIDQICEGKAIADREARDLRKMGCEVKVKGFASWEAAEAFQDAFEAKR